MSELTTYTRQEVLLGQVYVVRVTSGNRVTNFEANVIDGWIVRRERYVRGRWEFTGAPRSVSVGEVLSKVREADPDYTAEVVRVHLSWITQLYRAGQRRRASDYRRSLNMALERHGLALKE